MDALYKPSSQGWGHISSLETCGRGGQGLPFCPLQQGRNDHGFYFHSHHTCRTNTRDRPLQLPIFCYIADILNHVLFLSIRPNSLYSLSARIDSAGTSVLRARVSNASPWRWLDKSRDRPPVWLVQALWSPLHSCARPLRPPAIQSNCSISHLQYLCSLSQHLYWQNVSIS